MEGSDRRRRYKWHYRDITRGGANILAPSNIRLSLIPRMLSDVCDRDENLSAV
jgi:hypothetical protein